MTRFITRLLLSLLLLAATAACGKLIHDDLSDCSQGVDLRFYTQTPCEKQPAYPADMNRALVFVFDAADRLMNHYEGENIKLSPDYRLRIPFYQIGTFTFVVWGGADKASYELSEFVKGKTTKKELLITLKREAEKVNEHPRPLFYGVSEPLTMEDRSKTGSIFNKVDMPMRQYTNNLSVFIQGFPQSDEYEITLVDDNGKYSADGAFAPDTRFAYIPAVERAPAQTTARFTLLKLAKARNARLIITHKESQKVVFDKNIIEEIMHAPNVPQDKRPRLECENNYAIKLMFPDDFNPVIPVTYMAFRVNVLPWTTVINNGIILQ